MGLLHLRSLGLVKGSGRLPTPCSTPLLMMEKQQVILLIIIYLLKEGRRKY